MIYLGNQAVGVATFGTVNLLHTMTFTNALGSEGRQTVSPAPSWSEYDYLLFVPDLMVTAQEGQTNGNWLWFSISRGAAAASQYEGQSTIGPRGSIYTAVITKGYDALQSRYAWQWQFISGRGGTLALADQTDVDSETFADLTYTYGPYYGGTNGVMNGTVKVYGCILPK